MEPLSRRHARHAPAHNRCPENSVHLRATPRTRLHTGIDSPKFLGQSSTPRTRPHTRPCGKSHSQIEDGIDGAPARAMPDDPTTGNPVVLTRPGAGRKSGASECKTVCMAKLLIPQNSGFGKSDGPGRGAASKVWRLSWWNPMAPDLRTTAN